MSTQLFQAFAMNQRRLRKLRVEGDRPGSPFNGDGYAVLLQVLDCAAPEPGSTPPRFIFFEGLNRTCEWTGLSKSNAHRALKRFVAIGLLIERGMEHHGGYQPTMTYEVNVDLLTNGEGLSKWSTPSEGRSTPRGTRKGSPEGTSEGTPRGTQEGWQQNPATPSPTTVSAPNLNRNRNMNNNSNPTTETSPSASGRYPCQEGCQEGGEVIHRANVEHLTEALIAFERSKQEPNNPTAWTRYMSGKYAPEFCELEPRYRDQLLGDRFNVTNSLVDKVLGQ